MKFKESGTIKKGMHGKIYDTDQPLDVNTIISIIKSYENDETIIFECRCSTFTESGNTVDYNYRNTLSLEGMHNYKNPSINVRAIYVDPNSMEYKFTIVMAANTRGLNIFVNDDTPRYIKNTIELDRIEEEAEKKEMKASKQQVIKKTSYS